MKPVLPVGIRSVGLGLDGVPHSRVSRMLRPFEVCERTTLSPTHVKRLQHQHRFPPYVRIGARACGLPEHVLDAFLAARMAARATLPPLGFRQPLPPWCYCPDLVPPRSGLRLVRRAEVEALVGLGKSTFYPLIPLARFPAPVSLGVRAARWVAHEIDEWVSSSGLAGPPSSHALPVTPRVSAPGARS